MEKRFRPFLLTAAVVAADQLSKAWVVAHIPENTVGYRLFGDFLEIWHVRNDAVAFSMGSSLEVPVKVLCFILIPAVVLAFVARLVCADRQDIPLRTRWLLALFLGGGLGNLIDRVFRHLRVVDFMANRVYGLFGMEFWPTWNLADAALVVGAVLLALSVLCAPSKKDTV